MQLTIALLLLHVFATTQGLAITKNQTGGPIMDHEDMYKHFIDGDFKDYKYNCMCGYRSELQFQYTNAELSCFKPSK